jgi:hypothetical protein
VHARASPPPVQNDAVEQASTVACTASDERAERVIASVDLIYRLERINCYGHGTGGAQFVIKNLPDKSACADMASDDAGHERPNWGWLVVGVWLCRSGYPFRERDNDTSIIVAIFIRAVGQCWRHMQ